MTRARPPSSPLAENLNQHVITAQSLIEILARERAALMSQDVEALSAVNADKSAAATDLQRQGAALVALAGGAEGKALEAFICRQPDGLELLARWQLLLQLAGQCQNANMQNGILLQDRQQRVRASLQLIRQSPRPLYGPAGAIDADTGKRALARA